MDDALKNYTFDKLIDKLGNSGGDYLTFQWGFSTLKDIGKDGLSEIYSHGDLVDTAKNIVPIVQFAVQHPSDSLDALKNGFDSTTAVSVNALTRLVTAGYVDFSFTGQDVSQLTSHMNFGDRLYNATHGTAFGNAMGF